MMQGQRMKIGIRIYIERTQNYYMLCTYEKWAMSINENNFAKHDRHVAEDLEGVLPATAGATARLFEELCCSVVGSELEELVLPDGFRGALSSRSLPGKIEKRGFSREM